MDNFLQKDLFFYNKNQCLTSKDIIYCCTYFIPLIILFDQNLFLVRSKACFGQKAVAKHSAAGNIVCLNCGKTLKRQRSLQLHMRQHTGEKSYRVSPFIHCKYCTWCTGIHLNQSTSL
jgi:hypothetical protein